MNEKVEAAPPTALEEAPAEFRSGEPIERPEHASLRPEELRGTDLRGQDLRHVEELLPEHLAGADLTGAKLPDEIAKFPALDQVAAISSEARKIFIGLLAACVYSWLVIGTTTDVALILNTASSPLPIIDTPIPIAGFYVVGAALLAAVYCYLHFYLQRLWRILATLPAVLPDGVALDEKTDPWLLTNLVRAHFARLRGNAPPLARMENLLAVLLAWILVPITLIALWARYLPAHGWKGTIVLVVLISLTALFGQHTYRLARAELQGNAEPGAADRDGDSQDLLRRAWHEICALRADRVTVGLSAVLIVCSVSAFRDHPRDPYTWVAKGLNAVGIRTYADLRGVNFVEPPEDWDGKDWSKLKRVDLQGINLALANLQEVFLVNADLRSANLTGAAFYDAQLQGADLSGAELNGAVLVRARLQDANLKSAELQGAFLWDAQLENANLENAKLQGADLSRAQLQEANLRGVQLHGASLAMASLQGADLLGAELWGADLGLAWLWAARLSGARLLGASLAGAQLQAADLSGAQLQGADLRRAKIWRATTSYLPEFTTRWYLVDLRGSDVEEMPPTVIGRRIREATAKRPARPDFPEAWRSDPDVMFEPGDPKPEGFAWGPRKWGTEQDYDNDLAEFLADLACPRDVPEEQTRGLVQRALVMAGLSDGEWRGLSWFETGDPNRLWPRLFAIRLAGPDCPAAKGLPEDMRRRLGKLAARDDATAPPSEASEPDPVE